ncbi:hypothetical protein JL49_18935, partial [Pseudoalteromonas luteoviolacea]
GAALPALQQLDLKGIASGDVSSLMTAAPDLLASVGLNEASETLGAALPALQQLDLKGIASGDVSSLMSAAPGLLKAAGLGEVGATLDAALPALQKLDTKAILEGDLSSLMQQAPELLNAFGLQDAASLFSKHSALIEKLDFKGIINGDLSSLTGAVPDLLAEFGLGDLGLESLFDGGDEQEEKPKKSKKKHNKRNKSNKGVKRAHSDSDDASQRKAAKLNQPSQSNKPKRKNPAKPAFKVLDGGKAKPAGQQTAKSKGDKPAKQPTAKASTSYKAPKTANDSVFSKLGKFAGKKGGVLSSLAKGPAKYLGKLNAPLTVAMGAMDAYSALNDDTLSKQEKSSRVGGAVGGMGGALAGAAAGAAIGSVVPVIGTALGGIVGGAIGAFGGESAGSWLGDTLGGWFFDDDSKEDNQQAAGESNTSSVTALADGQAETQFSQGTVENAQPDSPLQFVKDNVINEANMVLSTMAAVDAASGKPAGKSAQLSKQTQLLGHALNGHTIYQAAANDDLSTQEKARTIGGTLTGALSAEGVEHLVGKIPKYGKFLGPVAGYLTNAAMSQVGGNFFASLFGGDETEQPKQKVTAKALPVSKPESLAQQGRVQSQITSDVQSKEFAGSVTVNANITVNTNGDEKAQDIAIQVKQILEQQQQQAVRDYRARYYNEVA